MKIEQNTKSYLKKAVLLEIIIFILIAVKVVLYPYALAPADFALALTLYDETQIPGKSILILWCFIFFIWMLSLFLLYKINKYGRFLYTLSLIAIIYVDLTSGYYAGDSIEYVLESLLNINEWIWILVIVVLIVVKGSYYISKTSNSNTNSYTHENYKLPEEQIERLKELSKKLKEKENL